MGAMEAYRYVSYYWSMMLLIFAMVVVIYGIHQEWSNPPWKEGCGSSRESGSVFRRSTVKRNTSFRRGHSFPRFRINHAVFPVLTASATAAGTACMYLTDTDFSRGTRDSAPATSSQDCCNAAKGLRWRHVRWHGSLLAEDCCRYLQTTNEEKGFDGMHRRRTQSKPKQDNQVCVYCA